MSQKKRPWIDSSSSTQCMLHYGFNQKVAVKLNMREGNYLQNILLQALIFQETHTSVAIVQNFNMQLKFCLSFKCLFFQVESIRAHCFNILMTFNTVTYFCNFSSCLWLSEIISGEYLYFSFEICPSRSIKTGNRVGRGTQTQINLCKNQCLVSSKSKSG